MTGIMVPPPDLVPLMEEVNQCMLAAISVLPGPVYDMVAPSIRRGKRIRGLLLLLCGLNAGASKEALIPVAAACELLHFATLVHDDIIDGHQERRGNPSVHTLTLAPAAVLTADSIFSISLSMLLETGNPAVIDSVIRTMGAITMAELVKYLQDRQITFSREEYYAWITAKTASLFRSCTFCGAVTGGADTDLSYQYSRIGELFGIAFQIRDDILDYTEDTLPGRVPGCDIRSGLVTLPLICYHDTCGITRELEVWMQGTGTHADQKALLTAVRRSEALEISQEEAGSYADLAEDMVRVLPSGLMKRALAELCRYAIFRDR
jgi:octaprenyl-diphosphate synthase